MLELGSAAFSERTGTTSQGWRHLNTSTAQSPRAEQVHIKGDVRAALFDFDGTLTATPGDRSERKFKIAELKERAPMLKPWLQGLRSSGIILGIISKSSEDTILTALGKSGLRELFDGPIVPKALGFEGKAGFIEDLCARSDGPLRHLGEEGLGRVLLVDDDLNELQRAREKSIQTFPAPQDGGLQYDDLHALFGMLGLEQPERAPDSEDICRVWTRGLSSKTMGLASDMAQTEFAEDKRPLFSDFYEVLKSEVRLGEGAFGVCSLGFHVPSGTRCAIKVIRKEVVGRHYLDNFVEEDLFSFLLVIAAEEPHPNVVRHLDVLMGPSILYIAMELLEGDDLDSYLQRHAPITQSFARKIIRQVMEALCHIHDVRGTGLIHRDVKLENLRFRTSRADSDLVLVDFGLSCAARPQQKRGVVGTLLYMAPEIFSTRYTTKVDLWSAGVLLYIVLTGQPPWKQEQPMGLCRNRRVADGSAVALALSADAVVNAPPLAAALLKELLVVDPECRISASDACQHDWLADCLGSGGTGGSSPVINVDKSTYFSAHAYTMQTPKAKLSLCVSMNDSDASPVAGGASPVEDDMSPCAPAMSRFEPCVEPCVQEETRAQSESCPFASVFGRNCRTGCNAA